MRLHHPPAPRSTRAAALLATALIALIVGLVPGSAQADNNHGGSPSGSGSVKDKNGSLVFGMGPANHVPAKQIVDGRAYLIYSADPGATIFDRVAVFNYFATPLRLQMYATDAVQGTDGGFGLLTGDQTPADAGSWITLLDVPKSGYITVPGRTGKSPYGVKYIRFIAKIPAKATPGDHVGGVVASLKSTSTNTTGPKVTLDQRVGIRAYFSLAGKLTPQLKIEDLHASYKNQWDPLGRGLYSVSYFVHNTGNLRLNVTQDVTIHRCIITRILCPVGPLVGHPAALEDLLPGSRVLVTETFHRKFGLGHLTAEVTLHAKAGDASYHQKIPDFSDSVGFWALPWLLILIILAVLLLVAGIVWRFLRGRRQQKLLKEELASLPVPKHAAPVPGDSGSERVHRTRFGRNRTIDRATRSEG